MKYCIFNKSKECNDCGDCNVCDLDKNKICNNCGKCLELEGYDLRAIKLDEIIDNETEIKEYQEEIEGESSTSPDDHTGLSEDAPEWEYIDDIKDIKDLLEEDTALSEAVHEEFPGLYVINNNSEQNQASKIKIQKFNKKK